MVFTSNALPTRTTERHITVRWCKEVSRTSCFQGISSQRFHHDRVTVVTGLQQAFVAHGQGDAVFAGKLRRLPSQLRDAL